MRVTPLVMTLALGAALRLAASPLAAQAARVDADNIAGVVTGPTGPEAGVWVIVETHDLPAKFVPHRRDR